MIIQPNFTCSPSGADQQMSSIQKMLICIVFLLPFYFFVFRDNLSFQYAGAYSLLRKQRDLIY